MANVEKHLKEEIALPEEELQTSDKTQIETAISTVP